MDVGDEGYSITRRMGVDLAGFFCLFVFFHKIVSQIWYAEPSEFHGLFVKLYVPEHHRVILYQSL